MLKVEIPYVAFNLVSFILLFLLMLACCKCWISVLKGFLAFHFSFSLFGWKIFRLMSMWRTMYECHQVQNHISQQVSHLINQQSGDPTTNYHRQAAFQLKTEVTFWYNSFRRVIKSQGEYVRALCRWIQLTYSFVEDSQRSHSASAVHDLCQEWQQALDRLPDKVFGPSWSYVYAFLITLKPIHDIYYQ